MKIYQKFTPTNDESALISVFEVIFFWHKVESQSKQSTEKIIDDRKTNRHPDPEVEPLLT